MKHSRVLAYLICSLFTLTFIATSCGDDDAADETINELLGTWSWTGNVFFNCTDPAQNFSEDDVCRADGCIKWQFREGGMLTATQISNADFDITRGTYSVSGGNLTVTIDGQTTAGTLRVSGNTFAWTRPATGGNCDLESTFTLDD